MSFLGNLIWLIFGGFVAGLGYILGGLALCLTIIGIPFGLRVISLGVATLAPFGKEVVYRERGDGCCRCCSTSSGSSCSAGRSPWPT